VEAGHLALATGRGAEGLAARAASLAAEIRSPEGSALTRAVLELAGAARTAGGEGREKGA
jgi:hypothetical protein